MVTQVIAYAYLQQQRHVQMLAAYELSVRARIDQLPASDLTTVDMGLLARMQSVLRTCCLQFTCHPRRLSSDHPTAMLPPCDWIEPPLLISLGVMWDNCLRALAVAGTVSLCTQVSV